MIKRFFLIGFFFASFISLASVNPDNGNFHVKYTDFVVLTQGMTIDVSRTYSSRSSFIRGMFGVGWSSELEGYLDVKPDTITYFEAGGGNAISFKKDQGNKWKSVIGGNQTITSSKEGYRLEASSGHAYIFNPNGRMSRIADTSGNYIDLAYTNEGQIKQLKDNYNNQVNFGYKTFGGFPRVTVVEGNEQKARYEYNEYGNLKQSIGMDAVPYVYEYDDQHNLTKISYQDGTFKQLSYNKARDWVRSYRDLDGMVTEYDYFSDGLDPENKFGTVIKQFHEGKPKEIEEARFWYEFRRKSSGERYKYRAVSMMKIPSPDVFYENNGKVPKATPYTVSETLYSECCGSPLKIATWEHPGTYEFPKESTNISWTSTKGPQRITKFEYYTQGPFQGFLQSKTLPNGMVIGVKYEPRHKKISELKRGKQTIGYKYDADGSPISVSDSLEQRLYEITYGMKGEITVVKESSLKGAKNPRIVYFRYNGAGQAVEIKETLAGGVSGSIQVEYSPTGRVSQVLNAQGRAIASTTEKDRARRISQTFTTLVELLRPVGLSFGPEG